MMIGKIVELLFIEALERVFKQKNIGSKQKNCEVVM